MASSCVSTYIKSGDIGLSDSGSEKSEYSEQGPSDFSQRHVYPMMTRGNSGTSECSEQGV